MDFIIISTSNAYQEQFWQKRLTQSQDTLKTKILVVKEEWPGGAGNGLGTLYAFLQAKEKAQELYSVDLSQELQKGGSIALYHTAGLGQRTAPLSSSEYNNKSAIELPGYIQDSLITLLEAVIKQTAIYAPSSRGRLTTFWGDQLFIPSTMAPTHFPGHATLFAKFGDFPNKEEWLSGGWQNYGLLVHSPSQQLQQMEKIDYETFTKLIRNTKISKTGKVAKSLGIFSLSLELLEALLKEFKPELSSKKGKLDSDPHFWMATTLDEETYALLMKQKPIPYHHQRMQHFRKSFHAKHPERPFFSAFDIGKESLWWDYGTVLNYYKNGLLMTQEGFEAELMRQFFQTPARVHDSPSVTVDSHSLLINCKIGAGSIKNSLLVGVTADSLTVENCVLINSQVNSLKADQCLLYHVSEKGPLQLNKNSVRADLFLSGEKISFLTSLDRDGKSDWGERLSSNPCAYADVARLLDS